MVTPRLFEEYPDAESLAVANEMSVQEIVRSTGFYVNKTKSLLGMAQSLVDKHDGVVPSSMEELTALPGVGRKTANVVRSVALDPVSYTHLTLPTNREV